MKQLLIKALNLLYENACCICSNPCQGYSVCKFCENNFVIRSENYLKRVDDFVVLSWAYYDGKLRQGIINLKNGKKRLANYFGYKLVELWEKILVQIPNKNIMVIPVPSHKYRIKERGYCQSSLIAGVFAKKLGLTFSEDLVIRQKETKFMNNLINIKERKENIDNAFKLINPIPKNIEHIILVDDILTSGSTLGELARTIYRDCSDINLIGVTVASGDKN